MDVTVLNTEIFLRKKKQWLTRLPLSNEIPKALLECINALDSENSTTILENIKKKTERILTVIRT